MLAASCDMSKTSIASGEASRAIAKLALIGEAIACASRTRSAGASFVGGVMGLAGGAESSPQ